MEDTWIREFYNETDPEARLEILNDHKLEDEIGLFMEKLWIARYGKSCLLYTSPSPRD